MAICHKMTIIVSFYEFAFHFTMIKGTSRLPSLNEGGTDGSIAYCSTTMQVNLIPRNSTVTSENIGHIIYTRFL